MRQPFNVNALAQVAALAALDDDEHVARTRHATARAWRYLREALRAPRARVRAELGQLPAGPRSATAARVYEALLRQGVIVRPMDVYGFPEHVRVTVGTAEENERFVAALEQHPARGRCECRGFLSASRSPASV